MPPFSESDTVLTSEQKQAISEWYSRAVIKKPTMPDIPKREATLYTDIRERDSQRFIEASNEIATQSIAVFPGSDYDAVLKLRKNCDERIFERVTYHWTLARRRWISYGVSLWTYRET